MPRYDEGPMPPRDEELRITIERVADFVGKFGPESELKTQRENQGNPKFDFIFGGQFSDYYQFCVHRSIERNRENTSQMQTFGHHSEVDDIRMRIDRLRQQIIDSERNLKAQLDSQATVREMEFSKRISAAESEKVSAYINKAQIDLTPFVEILDQLNNLKCSKDAISQSKKWIFEHCQTDQLREVILMYLSHRVKDLESSDSFRLNILYLINDWAHQCQRKKLDPVTQMLSRYVPQMYAFTVEMAADPNMNTKLEKLAGVWEGHKYFNDQCFKQLRNPLLIYNNAKQVLAAEYCKLGMDIDVQLQAMYAGYEQQHNNFAQHCLQQIKSLESELERFHHGADPGFNPNIAPPAGRRSRFDQQSRFEDQNSGNVGSFGRFFAPPSRVPIPKPETFSTPNIPDGDDIDGHPFNEEDLIPKAQYHSLPAGIMVPLIPMESLTYEPIVSSALRLPPPVPPSQRLLEAMDAFYAPPTSDKPRDTHGWEKNGLSDFFERKMHLKTVLQDKLSGERRTIEQMIRNKQHENDLQLEKVDREVALNKFIEQKKSQERKSRSKSRSRSRSRSSSASSYRRRSRSNSSSNRSSSRGSRSPRRRSFSRSRSGSPNRVSFQRRSPSPPSFTSFNMNSSSAPITGENKGALLMQKMGWSGTGLGAKETGIVEPVNAGEVRDKSGMYRGFGSRMDPYEQFRKQRSSSYHDRNLMASMERDRTRRD